MDTNDRLKQLEAWKIKKSIAESAAKQIEEENQSNCKKEILGLWDRAKAMLDLYNAGLDAGLPYPTNCNNFSKIRTLEVNAANNFMGFAKYGHSRWNKESHADSIAIHNTPDWYYIDLHDGQLDFKGSRVWSKLYHFVEEFDEFEKFFYETWDRLVSKYD